MSDADLPLFLRACLGLPTERTPVWLMRQAGRYMHEYMAIRKDHPFLEVCHTPELACEVTLQPIRAFGPDAAILFSDLLVPLEAMGAEVDFPKGGPVVTGGVDTVADVDRLRTPPAKETLGTVAEAVRLLCRELPADVPLIGFAGAPFTLGSYLIEGGTSRNFLKTKKFLFSEPEAAAKLFDKLVAMVTDFLNMQIEAGCRAVQVFDSWAGVLSPEDYDRWGRVYTTRIVEGLNRTRTLPDGTTERIPVIVFAKGTGIYYDKVVATGADVLGVDWTLPLERARAIAGPDIALQGNLEPAMLLAPWETLAPAIDRVLDAAGDGRGHVFNLGHGITPTTPRDNVKRLVERVHVESEKRRGA